MNIKPIKTKEDYQNALKRVEKLWSAKAGSKASDELDVLVTLIEHYEENNYPILPPDPIEAIKFRMDQIGLEQKDLAKIIGANRTSEILKKKRNLTLGMIRLLHINLGIPTDSLIG
ncbi:transcriptional regulator [Candidatus Parcubacteria bacterium]|nr:transcriptional regulator [Candidatus Parcubacteria bacterium]